MQNPGAFDKINTACFLVLGSDNDVIVQKILHDPMFEGETLLHKASRVRVFAVGTLKHCFNIDLASHC